MRSRRITVTHERGFEWIYEAPGEETGISPRIKDVSIGSTLPFEPGRDPVQGSDPVWIRVSVRDVSLPTGWNGNPPTPTRVALRDEVLNRTKRRALRIVQGPPSTSRGPTDVSKPGRRSAKTTREADPEEFDSCRRSNSTKNRRRTSSSQLLSIHRSSPFEQKTSAGNRHEPRSALERSGATDVLVRRRRSTSGDGTFLDASCALGRWARR